MTCEECEELLGAYALDAVTADEREAIRAHVAECANCARQLQELRSVVALLPLAVTQVEPPASLHERLFAAIRQERAEEGNGQSSEPTPLQQPRPSQRRQPGWARAGTSVAPALAVAAVLVLVLFGGMLAWNVSLQQQVSSLQQQNASLSRLLVKSYPIRGLSATPAQGATGEITYLPEQNLTVLVIRGLPQLQGTHVYQGWLILGKQPTSIGLLSVRDGIASVDYPGNISNYDTAAVSLEPGPGASKNAPRGPVVALGTLKSSTS